MVLPARLRAAPEGRSGECPVCGVVCRRRQAGVPAGPSSSPPGGRRCCSAEKLRGGAFPLHRCRRPVRGGGEGGGGGGEGARQGREVGGGSRRQPARLRGEGGRARRSGSRRRRQGVRVPAVCGRAKGRGGGLSPDGGRSRAFFRSRSTAAGSKACSRGRPGHIAAGCGAISASDGVAPGGPSTGSAENLPPEIRAGEPIKNVRGEHHEEDPIAGSVRDFAIRSPSPGGGAR